MECEERGEKLKYVLRGCEGEAMAAISVDNPG